jgi:hypothetical protein
MRSSLGPRLGIPLGATLLLASAVASGQSTPPDDKQSGIELGLRLGYGLPVGDFGRPLESAANEKFSHWVSGQSPIWIDAGYRFNPRIYAGLALQYAFVFANKANTMPCDGTCMRGLKIGVGFAWHLKPSAPFDPWVGIGAGYEWLGSDQRITRSTSRGFEFANLQLGGDFAVARTMRVGPFASLSFGQFSTITIAGKPYAGTQDFVEKSVHGWLVFGVRGVFSILL